MSAQEEMQAARSCLEAMTNTGVQAAELLRRRGLLVAAALAYEAAGLAQRAMADLAELIETDRTIAARIVAEEAVRK